MRQKYAAPVSDCCLRIFLAHTERQGSPKFRAEPKTARASRVSLILLTTFPNVKVHVDNIFAIDDKVAVKVHITGTHHIETYPTEESIIDAYWRTLTMNRHVGKDFGRKKPPKQFRVHFAVALTQLRRIESDTFPNVLREADLGQADSRAEAAINEAIHECRSGNMTKAEEFWLAASFWSKGRRFFLCENGYMGVGPPDAKQGDYVMVLKGGALPFVLRACNEQSITFADKAVEIADFKAHNGVNSNLEFDLSKESSFPPDLVDYLGLKPGQVGGPVDDAAQAIIQARTSRLEDFLRKEVACGEKADQPRYSFVGCSYVHGLSEAEALLQVSPLYSRDYLYALGDGWERVFLQ